ncbi:hypothetical protein A0J61_05457 [Choanephora cucurbitarum]|uniref:Uncharacterized protein n=1 Tax=Choanephora cucurbitarum TaxID=101091 RepID=A0A1C7NBQ8_9FUNG|nr:hypothetical protein A0J61_05457 [Choanephora cucurbitarum]
MSSEEVTVSLSRLALAKAIKTPDAGEEQEDWSKSVIFHQAHIDDQMLYSMQHPQQHGNRRTKPGRPTKQPIRYPQNNQRLVAPPMHRARSEEAYIKPPMPVSSLSSQNRSLPKSSAQSAHSVDNRSSMSINKLANHSKQGRRYVPSDEEDNEESEEEESEEEDSEEEVIVPTRTPVPTKTTAPVMSSPLPQKNQPLKKPATRAIQPSDDEESESESEEEESDDEAHGDDKKNVKKDEKDTEETEKLYARRMSTLRQLERGSSLHKKSHSTGSLMMLPPADAFIEPTTSLMDTHAAMENAALNAAPPTPGKLGTIEQWRVTVMEAEDMSQPTSTPLSTASSHSPAETVEDDESLVEEPIVRSLNTSSSHLPAMRSQSSLVPNPRASTMDLEMMYYQQQQQMYNMQMQQAMQLQQAHQMAQIQQYQQAIQMQQQQMYAYNNSTTSLNNINNTSSSNKSSHRKSVSAMDLMMQLEQEKAATRKNNKKKMPDPSKANLNEGLLSHVPKHGQHNINFQQQVRKMQHTMPRASISDYHLQQLQQQQQQQKTRPSSSMNIYNMQHASQSSMLKMPRGGDMSPIPTMSTSTPLNQQQAYFIPQQQPMLMPPQQMPMMDSNRSSQYLSNNSKRQSTMNKF